MKSTTVEKTNWQSMLDQVSRHNKSKQVTIEIDAPSIGAQTQAEDVQLRGITYDPKDDAVSVDADGLEHTIRQPSKVEIAYEGVDLMCIEILDGEGGLHLVKFAPPLSLPEIEQHL